MVERLAGAGVLYFFPVAGAAVEGVGAVVAVAGARVVAVIFQAAAAEAVGDY